MLGRSKSAVVFTFVLTDSFTGRHVNETKQKATTIMKEGYTSQTRLLLFLVQ